MSQRDLGPVGEDDSEAPTVAPVSAGRPPTGATSAPLAIAYAIMAGLALVFMTLVAQAGGWVVAQYWIAMDQSVDTWSLVGVSVFGALLLGLGVAPLLFARKYPRIGGTAWLWLAAVAIMAALGFGRLVPAAIGGLEFAVQAAICGALVLGTVCWRKWWRGRAAAEPVDDAVRPAAPGAFWWAGCAGALTVLPWAMVGALGDIWETLAAGLAAVAFAILAAYLCGDWYWRRFTGTRTAVRVFAAGAAVGVALLLAASGLGGTGVNLLAMVTVAPLGPLLAVLLRRAQRTGRVVAAAVAPAVFGPLAFTDADEFLPLVFGPWDFGWWQLVAAVLAILLAWAATVLFALLARRLVAAPSVGAGVLVVVVAAVSGVNALAQPGLHGERIVVVMAEQADLSGIDGDRDERLTETHRRLVEHARDDQRSLRAELDDRGLDYTPYYLVNAIEVDTNLAARSWLDDRADVAAVLLSPQLRPIPSVEFLLSPAIGADASAPPDGTQPNIEAVGAPTGWRDGVTGQGITIGIADSGVDVGHQALADGYRGGADSWADPVNGTTAPEDPNGHGTHALGLALGADGIGVAPDAEWIGCANLPRNAGNPADYLACLQFMLAPYPVGGDPFDDGDPLRAPHIVSNSWGCPAVEGCDANVLGPAVSALTTAGIFTVVAAGNSGPDCESAGTPPARYPDAYTVGAVTDDGTLLDFSSRGPVTIDGRTVGKPDITAPGDGVWSAVPDGYARLSGTSMATPHVAGAVALLWSARPELIGDIDATAALLSASAEPVLAARSEPIDACGAPANAAGAGMLDVAAALDLR